MTFKRNKRIDNQEPLRMWFWSLVGILILCSFSYGYFVQGVIVNVVARQNLENQLSSLNSQVLNLEANYIKVKNSITPELAENLGFVVASSQKFVTRDVRNPGLSLVTSGI